MNFLIEPSVTLSDLGGIEKFHKKSKDLLKHFRNVLSKFYKEYITYDCHLSRSRHRMLALFPLPIHASITFYVILKMIVLSEVIYLVIHAVKLTSAEPS